MSSEYRKDEEIRELLRDVVASNLTVAYQMEMLRREMQPRDEKEHPFAHVLELYEMVREVMDPDAEDADDDDALEPGDEDLEDPGAPGSRPRGGMANPFASTMQYLRRKR